MIRDLNKCFGENHVCTCVSACMFSQVSFIFAKMQVADLKFVVRKLARTFAHRDRQHLSDIVQQTCDHLGNFSKHLQVFANFSNKNIYGYVAFGAVLKCINLVDLEGCCKRISVYLQKPTYITLCVLTFNVLT